MSVPPSPSTTPAGLFDAPASPAARATEVAETAGLMRFDLVETPAAPRARDLARRYGVDALRDEELLAFHLASANPSRAVAMAKLLMAQFGGLSAVLAADRAALARHVGPEAALELKIVRETAVRLAAALLPARLSLSAYTQVAAYLKTLMAGLPREAFWVLFLDRKNQLLRAECMGVGTVDHAPVYPREVLRRALELNASALILAHNHPSGDATPSRPDIEMTRAVIDAGKALRISVHDHMIVGGGEVRSLRASGLI